MSHTNSTENYNLPQFLGTDKPAWLGDINPAMSAIDTAIKTASDNATTASTGTTANTTAIGTLANLTTTAKSDLVSAINEVDSDLATTSTQVGTNTGDISALDTKVTNLTSDVDTLKNAFNLSNVTTSNISGTNVQGELSLAQNSTGSVFKVYGNIHGTQISMPRTLVPGSENLTNRYAVATGLFLSASPDKAYQINTAGLDFVQNTSFALRNNIYPMHIIVGGDGQIYLWPSSSNTSITSASGERLSIWLPCTIYFNTNFGDIDS